MHALEARSYFSSPVLDAISDRTVPAGKTIQVPLTATDADGNSLQYSVSSDNAVIVPELHPTTNTWLKLATTQGTMLFQLFDDVAPNTVANMTGLVNAGFFNGLKFYSIAKNLGSPLYIAGGSPTGTSTGGPGFRFDDEFDRHAIFSNPGVLAMLNAGKDNNGSQFFVTANPVRSSDFNYTIWGQLVRGYQSLDKFFNVPVGLDNQPMIPQEIISAKIVTDMSDAVLLIKASDVGNATITVNVDDGHGGTDTGTFHVYSQSDEVNAVSINDPPILAPVSDLTDSKNKPVTFKIGSVDLEGDPGEYAVSVVGSPAPGSAVVNGNYVTFTPRRNLTGPVNLFVGVRAPGATMRGSFKNPYDTQAIQIGVGDLPARGKAIDLDALPGINTGKQTLATFKDTDPFGRISDWSVLAKKDSLGVSVGGVNWGDGTVGDGAVVRNKGGGFAIVGSHVYPGPGKYPITMTLQGNLGARLVLRSTATVRAFAERNGDTLTVNGSAASETIDIGLKSGVFSVSINGIAKRYDATGITQVNVNAMGGNDTVSLHHGVPAAQIDGGPGSDLLSGGDFNDTIVGGAGDNTIFGNGGNDSLTGGKGRDSIGGGDGSDVLIGGAGDDTLDGGAQSDDLYGGDGNDVLIGGGSSDRLFGQGGNDHLLGGKGADTEDGGDGSDQAEQDGSDQTLHVETILTVVKVMP